MPLRGEAVATGSEGVGRICGDFIGPPELFPSLIPVDGAYELVLEDGVVVESDLIFGGGHTSLLLCFACRVDDGGALKAAIRPYNPVTLEPLPVAAAPISSSPLSLGTITDAPDDEHTGRSFDTSAITLAFVPLTAFKIALVCEAGGASLIDPSLYLAAGRGKVPA